MINMINNIEIYCILHLKTLSVKMPVDVTLVRS